MISNSNCSRMWLGSIVLSAALILPVFLSSCGEPTHHKAADENEPVVIDTLPDDFVAFFYQFHEDTAYQMAHILFPLEGLPPAESNTDTFPSERYFWQRENWQKHKHFTDPGGNFDHWYVVVNDRIIEHWINLKGTNLHMKRRFAKLDNGWYLIYYQGLRPTDPEFK